MGVYFYLFCLSHKEACFIADCPAHTREELEILELVYELKERQWVSWRIGVAPDEETLARIAELRPGAKPCQALH